MRRGLGIYIDGYLKQSMLGLLRAIRSFCKAVNRHDRGRF